VLYVRATQKKGYVRTRKTGLGEKNRRSIHCSSMDLTILWIYIDHLTSTTLTKSNPLILQVEMEQNNKTF